MRKKIALLAGIVVMMAGVLWLLPATVVFSKSSVIDRPYQVIERNLIHLNAWSKWWPGKRIADSVFEYNGISLKIDAVLLNGFQATAVQTPHERFVFQVAAQEGKKTQIHLAKIVQTDGGMWQKAGVYLRYFAKRKMVANWIDAVHDYFSDAKKVYGMDIVRTRVTDSVLVALKQPFNHEPKVDEVYALIKELKGYIAMHNGKEDNYPMVNVYKEADSTYLCMVAIATGIPLPVSERYLLKKMELGYILKGEVRGGVATVKQALDHLNAYAIDYEKTAPAIPYQLWVTDRQQQPDTAQWITQLYFPIFY